MSDTDKRLTILLERPFFAWERKDQEALPRLLSQLVGEGRIIVLGQKRCFFCGVEIENEIERSELTQGSGRGLIVTNQCTKCSALARG